jgi:hypothetical protein
MTRGKIRCLGAVVIIWCNDSIVGPNFQHVFARLRRATVHRECVVGTVDGPPVVEIWLKTGFYFPILDQIFNKAWEASSFVGLGLG